MHLGKLFGFKNSTQRGLEGQASTAYTGNAFKAVPVDPTKRPGLLRLYRGLQAKRMVVLSCWHLREENGYRPFRLRGVGDGEPTHEFRLQSAIPEFVGKKIVPAGDIRVHFRAQIDVSEGRISRREFMIQKFRNQGLYPAFQMEELVLLHDCADRCARSATEFLYNRIVQDGALVATDMGTQNLGNPMLEDLGEQIRQKGFLNYSGGFAIDFGTSNADAIFWATAISLWIKRWDWPDT